MAPKAMNRIGQGTYSVEEYTPDSIWGRLGPIDIDPCAGQWVAPDGSVMKTTIGITNWTKADDGLGRSWPKDAFLFVNPPFDRKDAVIDKCAAHGNCILLLPNGPSAKWLARLNRLCCAKMELDLRIKFHSPAKGAHKYRGKFTTALFAFGDEAVARLEASGIAGALWVLRTSAPKEAEQAALF